MEQVAVCSKGWGERCPQARGKHCTCAFGGANHNKQWQLDIHQEIDEIIAAGPPAADGMIEFRRELVPLKGNRFDVLIDGVRIDPGPSLKIRSHSPDGFSWGYGGSGPAQCALGILLHLTGDPELSQRLYQDFKWQYIANIPSKGGELSIREVRQWIADQK